MEQLRIKKRTYDIQVNDNGDVISFNVEDPSLYLKMQEAYQKVNELSKQFEKEIAELEQKEEVKDGLMSNVEIEAFKLEDKMFKEMRNAMDIFLGKNACQKIFGDTNYIEMYEDLFEQLQPHFEKMGMNMKRTVSYIEEKYKKENVDYVEVSE